MTSQLLSVNQFRHWLTENTHLLLRLLIITSVLLTSTALAFKAPQRLLLLIPALLIGFLIVRAFMRWPILGLLAIIGSIIIPINGPSGVNATMGLVVMLLGLWVLDMIVRQRKLKLVPSKTIPPLLTLMFVAILAFGIGQLPWYYLARSAPLGAQLGGLVIYILSAGTFLLTAHHIRNLRWLKWMTWLFLTMGALCLILYSVPDLNSLGRIFFPPSTTGSLFWTWLIALAFSQAAFNQDLNPSWRVLLSGLVFLALFTVFFKMQAWSSGWVPSIAAIMIIVLIAKPKLGLAITLIGVMRIIIQNQQFISLVTIGDNLYSLTTRLDAWIILMKVVKVNPILGLGPANYYWYTPLFPIRGYSVHFNSHNQYIDLITQTGLFGLISFLMFFGAVLWLGWRLRTKAPSGFPQAYVYGALGGLAGTLVAAALGDWVIPFFYNIGLTGFRSSMLGWLFMGGLVALEQMIRFSDGT